MPIDSFKYLSPTSAAIIRMLIARGPGVTEPIPWTSLPQPLSESTVALVSTAAPLRRLDELVRAGFVGGVAPSHYAFQGYLLDPTEFLATSVPAMVEQMKRE